MQQVTIKYGLQQVTRSVPEGTTFRQVMQDSTVRAVLGYGDNVRCLIDGDEQPEDGEVSDGDVINIETRANKKAA